MKTLNQIKSNYNNPVALCRQIGRDLEGKYCVGGAVCATAGIHNNFPAPCTLANGLMKLNARLREQYALILALGIIGENEFENFESAWDIVDKALKHKGL